MSEVEFPLILVNLKTYEEGLGDKAVRLAKIAQEVSESTGVCVALSPQTVDIRSVIEAVEIPIFAQHVDPVSYGKFTGHTSPEAVAAAGGVGTLINHSERKLHLEIIGATIERAREAGLLQVVCVDTVEKGMAVAPFNPNVIAIEPPELIGTGIPVSQAKPEIVSEAVKSVNRINPAVKVLCGAGITSGEDVSAALFLGSEGVLVASGVVKADDPQEKLLDLAGTISP
jgi:triosephosphate isomerase